MNDGMRDDAVSRALAPIGGDDADDVAPVHGSAAGATRKEREAIAADPQALLALGALIGRLFLHDRRAPTFVIINVIQPLIWLLLFGSLFSGVTRLAGFPTDNYFAFLAPGLMVMTSLFGSAFSGMSLLMDEQRGLLDRFFTSPVPHWTILASYVLHTALIVMVQASVILLAAMIAGARPSGGFIGLLATYGAVFLIGGAVGALSNALALVLKRHDAVIGVMNFMILPLVFLSTMMIARPAMPIWMLHISLINPVDWAVTVARAGFFGHWQGDLWRDMIGLAVFFVLMTMLAGRAFRRQRLSG
ncbi:MAG: ABC transporter permease [Alphaproteobacteria bacterium]|nr:MAG: ABC transporter permease [Alphaproteobacteria bacterium]